MLSDGEGRPPSSTMNSFSYGEFIKFYLFFIILSRALVVYDDSEVEASPHDWLLHHQKR